MTTPAATERVLVLPATAAAALGAVRTWPGLRLATAPDGQLWLRGLPAAGPLPAPLRQLPARATYALDDAGRLFPGDALTPTAELPALAWQPLREALPLTLPTAALPGQRPAPFCPPLQPSGRAEPGAALLTSLAAWRAYADAAPAARLARLRFAVSERGQALLVGAPLPPLPGQEFWQHRHLLLPAGLAFDSPLVADLVADRLPPRPNGVVLLAADGSWEAVPDAALVPTTRRAVRLTTEEVPAAEGV